MCGQVGLILGTSKRTRVELTHLANLFSGVLKLSERRGRHATGVALLKDDGECRLYKNVVPASEFVRKANYRVILDSLDNRTTVLMGHTRWATVGDPSDPVNAHPIRAGAVIGTANGTITNADWLFRRFNLPRHAEVDSEVIFRLADEARGGCHEFSLRTLASRLVLCTGSIASVMVAKTDPGHVIMVKGNKPLEMMFSSRYRAILYASDLSFIKQMIGTEPGGFEMTIPRNAILAVDSHSLKVADIVPVGWKGNTTL